MLYRYAEVVARCSGKLAAAGWRRISPQQTLQATALVHEERSLPGGGGFPRAQRKPGANGREEAIGFRTS